MITTHFSATYVCLFARVLDKAKTNMLPQVMHAARYPLYIDMQMWCSSLHALSLQQELQGSIFAAEKGAD